MIQGLIEFIKQSLSISTRTYRTLGIILGVSLLISLICQNPFRTSGLDLQMGDVARKNIKANKNIRVVDEELTEKKRNAAAQLVLDVYDLDPMARRLSLQKLNKALDLLNLAPPEKWDRLKSEFENTLDMKLSPTQWKQLSERNRRSLLKKWFQRLVVKLEPYWIVAEQALPTKPEIIVRDIRTGDEVRVPQAAYQAKILPLGEARDGAKKALEKAGGQESLPSELYLLLTNLLEPDLALNHLETKARRDEAGAQVESVWAEISQGEMIIREGQKVDRRHLVLLQGMEGRADESLPWAKTLYLAALFFSLILLFFHIGQSNFRKFRFNFRDQWVLGSFLVVSVAFIAGLDHLFVAARSETAIGPSLHILLPLAFAGMTIRLFTSMEITTFFIILFSIAVGWLRADAFFGMTALATGLVGAARMRHITQRLDVFKAGLMAGGTKALMNLLGLGFGLAVDPGFTYDWLNLTIIIGFSIGSGVISASLILGIQPLLEYLGYTTDLRLMELSSTNHPLLKDLILKAPGTYFHSFTVSQLAEKAAEAIHANALFARVSSLYHDIGKVKKPQYFIENIKGENKHDKLAPSMSALIISNHVKDGIELGYEHNLPQSIIEVIPQHHGTSLISFFYDKAKKQAEENEEVEEREFRYPGPKPQTRESAIILLADAVEATAKSLQNKSPDMLKQIVHQTIQRFFLDGQLDECELTLKDLNAIGNAFLQVLQGVYHQRIDYPHLKEGAHETDDRSISTITKLKAPST